MGRAEGGEGGPNIEEGPLYHPKQDSAPALNCLSESQLTVHDQH